MLEHMKLAKAKRIGPNPSNEEAHEAILSHNFINTKAISRTSRIINIWKDNLTNRFFSLSPPYPPSSILFPFPVFPNRTKGDAFSCFSPFPHSFSYFQ